MSYETNTVMLILIGVSISLVFGQNGVMTQAGNAKTKTSEADAKQAVQLAFADLMTQFYADTTGDTDVQKVTKYYTETKLTDAIKTNGATEASKKSGTVAAGNSLIFTVDGIDITVTLKADATNSKPLAITSIKAPSETV